MWRDEIYERAPDFKSKVAAARFRSSEWRFLAALDGRRTAGEIARDLGLDDAAAAKFVDAQERAGAIVPSLLSFEEFERVAGPLDAAELERDFPEAALAALREPSANGISHAVAAAQEPEVESTSRDSSSARGKAPSPEDGASDTAPRGAEPESPSVAPSAIAPIGGAKIDASIGTASETLRKLRARAITPASPPEAPHSPSSQSRSATAVDDGAAPSASTPDVPPAPAQATYAPLALVPTPIEPAPEPALPVELDAAQTSILEALATETPEPERAIVHESATVIPLSSVLERVGKTERLDPETAAWNAVLEQMRGEIPRDTQTNGATPAEGDARSDPPPNVRRLPFGKRPST